MEQKELGYLYLINGLRAVEQSIIESFRSTEDALLWSYENRVDAGGKPKTWVAKHMKKRRQTITKILQGINKLDPTEVYLWDSLMGTTAVQQYVDLCNQRMKQAQAKGIHKLIMQGMEHRIGAAA